MTKAVPPSEVQMETAERHHGPDTEKFMRIRVDSSVDAIVKRIRFWVGLVVAAGAALFAAARWYDSLAHADDLSKIESSITQQSTRLDRVEASRMMESDRMGRLEVDVKEMKSNLQETHDAVIRIAAEHGRNR